MNVVMKPYPGADVSPFSLLRLAHEYRRAAETLLEKVRPGDPISRVPARLCALHAIELYLSAFLLHRGTPAEKVRSHSHNLAARATLATDSGLMLRKLTAAHLATTTDNREYLISRYAPDMVKKLSETNRLMATLNEVGKKVTAKLVVQASPA